MPLARRLRLTLLPLLAAAVACANPSAPAVAATVLVASESIVASRVSQGGLTWVRFTVPLTVRNDGATEIRTLDCGASVEALVNARWTRVWSPICAAASGVTIPAGSVRDVSVMVNGKLDGQGGPAWSGPLDSSYRVVLSLVTEGIYGAIPQVPSDPFALREAP